MRSARSTFLLLLVLLLGSCVLFATSVHADEDAAAPVAEEEPVVDDYAEEELTEEQRKRSLAATYAMFPGASPALSLPAGTTVNSLIAFLNSAPNFLHTVVLIAGHLTPVNQYRDVIQNFSVVRHARTVRYGETVSFQYSFTPDALLEPREYNLLLSVYFHDNVSNATYYLPAYNGTVTIDEATGTDPKTILTYLTLLAILGGVGYFVAEKTGVLAMLKSRGTNAARRRVEVGTGGEGYDPDYISQEHHKYKESVLQRKPSASPNKKKH